MVCAATMPAGLQLLENGNAQQMVCGIQGLQGVDFKNSKAWMRIMELRVRPVLYGNSLAKPQSVPARQSKISKKLFAAYQTRVLLSQVLQPRRQNLIIRFCCGLSKFLAFCPKSQVMSRIAQWSSEILSLRDSGLAGQTILTPGQRHERLQPG